MQQVYGNVTKVLVDSRQGSNLLYLPIDKIMQMSAQTGVAATAPVDAPAAAPVVPAAPVSLSNDARLRDVSRSRDRDVR
jgi:membrane protease subunit HflK